MSCRERVEEERECEATPTRTTYCDRDRANNVWIEGADENGEGGICLLDTMTEEQVVYSLQRDERAREDLLRVTSDAYLLNLARTVSRLPTGEYGDLLQQQVNRNNDSLPFYNLFKGKPPWSG